MAEFNTEIEVSESGRRYTILRYGRIFIAKMIEDVYTDGVFNALAIAYVAKTLRTPSLSAPQTAIEVALECKRRNPQITQGEIAETLNQKGHTTVTGCEYSQQNVHHLFKRHGYL